MLSIDKGKEFVGECIFKLSIDFAISGKWLKLIMDFYFFAVLKGTATLVTITYKNPLTTELVFHESKAS